MTTLLLCILQGYIIYPVIDFFPISKIWWYFFPLFFKRYPFFLLFSQIFSLVLPFLHLFPLYPFFPSFPLLFLSFLFFFCFFMMNFIPCFFRAVFFPLPGSVNWVEYIPLVSWEKSRTSREYFLCHGNHVILYNISTCDPLQNIWVKVHFSFRQQLFYHWYLKVRQSYQTRLAWMG